MVLYAVTIHLTCLSYQLRMTSTQNPSCFLSLIHCAHLPVLGNLLETFRAGNRIGRAVVHVRRRLHGVQLRSQKEG